MRRYARYTFVAFILMVVALSMVPIGFADERHFDNVVRKETTTVPKGATVEDLLVLEHDVNVQGNVSEILVVVDGNVHIGPSAHAGIVVDLNGTVTQDAGATAEGIYRLSLHSPFWSGTLFGITGMLLLWTMMLAVGLLFMLISLLVTFAVGRHMTTPLAILKGSVRRTGIIGLLTTAVVCSICALFAMTEVGIPLAGIVLLIYAFVGLLGLSVVSTWLGELAFTYAKARKPMWLDALVGAGICVALMNIPVVGMLLILVLWLVGIGVVTAWLYRMMKRRGSVTKG
jgi:hypothetical protein